MSRNYLENPLTDEEFVAMGRKGGMTEARARQLLANKSKKEESKYYVPDISEFYLGFEFESHTISSGGVWMPDGEVIPPVPVWNKEVFNERHLDRFNCAYDFKAVLEDKRIRVKHLDREDIESLGYDFSGTRGAKGTHITEAFDKKKKNPVDSFTHITIYHDVIRGGLISIEERDDERRITKSHCYNLTIKNKSELKRVLKQIGV